MNGRMDTERILDAFLAPEPERLADRVIDAALTDIARTPQRRALRLPWRFPIMPALTRTTGMAAVALVAIVGAGGLILANSPRSGSGGGPPTPIPTPTAVPTVAPTPRPSELFPGITGWKTYTSAVFGFDVSYPSDWTVDSPATDTTSSDVFMNPEGVDGDQIALLVSEVAVGKGVDAASLDGLKAWARNFCIATAEGRDGGAAACETWPDDAIPMCYVAGGNTCRAAIIVPEVGGVSAFFEDWESTTTGPAVIRAVGIGRPDDFPAAARYGGGIQLMKSILTQMNVVTPRPGQVPGS